ncbi:MAG: cytochrome c3 family protein [Methyloceanibacter sp.]
MTRRSRKSSTKVRSGKRSPAPKQAPEEQAKPSPVAKRKTLWVAAAIAALIVVGAGFALEFLARAPSGTSSLTKETPTFVGSATCITCHSEQGGQWDVSQHAHAMAHAKEETVFGDFDDAEFDYFGVKSRFFRKDGKFFIETDGPDGKLQNFEVKYTFGLEPLQQYLIEFPDGRVQALSIAWDSRTKEEGGQRWFHLYPDEDIGHDDPLHWTRLNQNWNFMCAECHSTGLAKNYDAATDHFATTWKEISVGCEACHGQGSAHVAWAKDWSPFAKKDNAKGLLARFDERSGISWSRDPKTDKPQRSATPVRLRKEVEMCGRCHARRGQVSEDWLPGKPLSDSHVASLITRDLYQPDGQKLDEVYNYGSFKQSKMFAAGVTCSDCHDPHSAKLRFTGNQVCLQCHAGTYAEPTHTHHEDVSAAPDCIACHMPARTFMVVDKRHDHSFRVPRPDLSVSLGVTNACNDCHVDKSADWAATVVEDWFGPDRKGFQTHGPAFHAAWHGAADAESLLSAVAADADAPAFTRASALADLLAYPSRATANLVGKGLTDPDPMVRIAALNHLETSPPAQLWSIVSPLLDDPVRGVRIKAAFLLGGVPTQDLSAADRSRLARAEKDFMATQDLNADRPEARALLGRYLSRTGKMSEAEAEYRAALRLSPEFAPAAVNLADLYRELSRDADGEAVLRQALKSSPQDGGLHHALGLTLVRLKRQDEAIESLARAVELERDRARYAYVYAIALNSTGQRAKALQVLEDNVERHPGDRESLLALVNFSRADSKLAKALRYAEQLAKIEPDNQQLAVLIQALRREVSKPAE